VRSLSAAQRAALVTNCTGFPLTVTALGDYKIAMVRGRCGAGGVNAKNHGIKDCTRPFFCGEVLDVDGDTAATICRPRSRRVPCGAGDPKKDGDRGITRYASCTAGKKLLALLLNMESDVIVMPAFFDQVIPGGKPDNDDADPHQFEPELGAGHIGGSSRITFRATAMIARSITIST